MKKVTLFGVALGALFACQSQASKLVTFDDLGGGGTLPDGYQGVHWTNFFYVNGTVQVNSGYKPAVVSPNNVAFSGGGNPAFLGNAELDSGYFTAVWRDGLQLQVIGMLNGAPVSGFDHTYTLNATNATFITFNYTGIDTIEFLSSGGVQHAGYSGDGTQFAMDNVVIPEPATTLVLLAFGASALWMRRKTAA
jgi:hypothetical protein